MCHRAHHRNLTTHPKVPPLQLTGRERSLGRGRAAPGGFCAQGQGTTPIEIRDNPPQQSDRRTAESSELTPRNPAKTRTSEKPGPNHNTPTKHRQRHNNRTGREGPQNFPPLTLPKHVPSTLIRRKADLATAIAAKPSEYSVFSAALKKAEAEAQVEWLSEIARIGRTAASRAAWQAYAWLLERRHPADWSRRTELVLPDEQAAKVDPLVGVHDELRLARLAHQKQQGKSV